MTEDTRFRSEKVRRYLDLHDCAMRAIDAIRDPSDPGQSVADTADESNLLWDSMTHAERQMVHEALGRGTGP